MRDAPGRRRGAESRGDPLRPVVGEALPVFGMVAFYDFQWSERFRSAIGYSRLDVENSDGQLPAAFKSGQYALANLLFSPVKDVMTGLEFQWGRRAELFRRLSGGRLPHPVLGEVRLFVPAGRRPVS